MKVKGSHISTKTTSVEQRVRVRARKQNIRRAVLTSIKIAGVLAVAVAAPNALRLLRYIPRQENSFRRRINRSFCALEKQHMIDISYSDGRQIVSLTRKGEKYLNQFTLGERKFIRPKQWDHKWRIVIFDIPERRKIYRQKLRLFLLTLGFCKLQNSVWVFPYECEDLIQLLKTEYTLGKEVLYMVVDALENDARLIYRFKLNIQK